MGKKVWIILVNSCYLIIVVQLAEILLHKLCDVKKNVHLHRDGKGFV